MCQPVGSVEEKQTKLHLRLWHNFLVIFSAFCLLSIFPPYPFCICRKKILPYLLLWVRSLFVRQEWHPAKGQDGIGRAAFIIHPYNWCTWWQVAFDVVTFLHVDPARLILNGIRFLNINSVLQLVPVTSYISGCWLFFKALKHSFIPLFPVRNIC